MALYERLAADMKEAMKSGNKVRLSALRMAKAAIVNAEIAKGKDAVLTDAETLEVLSREVKRRRESIAEFKKANRPDAVAREEADLAVLMEYLPQQMSREEIADLARKVIQEVGARGPKDKGKVMGKLMLQLKGKAEGQVIGEVVSHLLESA